MHLPSVPDCKKSSIRTSNFPKHLSGELFIQYLQKKKAEKEKVDKEKHERKKKRT